MKRKVFFAALLCSFSLSACGGRSTATTEAPTETSIEESTAEETTESSTESDEWADVKALNLDNATMLSIYQDYQTAWESVPEDPEQQDAYDKQVDENIGEKYGISADDAFKVYTYVLTNYDKMAAENGGGYIFHRSDEGSAAGGGSFAGNAGLYDFYGIRPSVRYRRQLSDIESTGRTP